MLEDLTVFVVRDCIGENDYSFGFKIFNVSHLDVYRITEAGVYTNLTLNSDYTVAGQAGKFESGGTITTTSTFSDGKIYMGRKVPLKQQAHFPDTGRFPAKPVEDQFDKMVMMIQVIDQKIIGAIKSPLGEDVDNELPLLEARKGGYLFFRESDGKPISVTDLITSPVSSYVAASLTFENDSDYLGYFGALGRFLPEVQERVLKLISLGMRGKDQVVLSDFSGIEKGAGNTLNIPRIDAILKDPTNNWYHYVEVPAQTNWVPNQLFQDNVTTNYLKISVDTDGVHTIQIQSTPAVGNELLLASFVTVAADIDSITTNNDDHGNLKATNITAENITAENIIAKVSVTETLDPNDAARKDYVDIKAISPIWGRARLTAGRVWQNAASGVLDISWWGVTWSPELGLFCAVAIQYGAANQRVMVSPDGLNWSFATSGVVENPWRSVTWSPELGIFCATASSGTTNNRVMVSSDGFIWTNATSGVLDNPWDSVIWSPELGIFCAVATTGTTNQRVMVSSDGLIWTNATSGVLDNAWLEVIWCPELSIFCATAITGTTNGRVMVSSDGLIWSNATSGVLDNSWSCVAWSPELGIFCAVATSGTTNQRVMVSSDGLIWTNATSGVLDNSWESVTWSPELGIFCAVADTGTTNGRVMVSSDGLIWTNATSGVLGNNWQNTAWSPELGIFCGVSVTGTTNGRVMLS